MSTRHSGISEATMGTNYNSKDVENLDFTIARSFSDSKLLNEVQNYLTERGSDEIELDRHTLNSELKTDQNLSKKDAERLFTGLIVNGAAKQTGGGNSFADYTFRIDTESAADALEIQRIALVALQRESSQNSHIDYPQVELTGTFPEKLSVSGNKDIQPISDNLRRMIFDAELEVRIANPYFDPSPAVVGDIASLANRGVQTKILTRETSSANANLRQSLNSMYESIDSCSKNKLRVRDLYKTNSTTGQQDFATHAKIVVVDREICYLGSANLTETSLSDNFELGVILREEIVESVSSIFDDVFRLATPVKLPI